MFVRILIISISHSPSYISYRDSLMLIHAFLYLKNASVEYIKSKVIPTSRREEREYVRP